MGASLTLLDRSGDQMADQEPSRLALINGRIVLPHQLLVGGALLLEDGRIAAITADSASARGLPTIDVGGRLVTPGLIDIHTHGAAGHSFNDPSTKAYAVITAAQARAGVTGLLATMATDTVENLAACLAATRSWMTSEQPGAQLLGSHVEGPYFALAQAGAQDPAQLRTPDDGSAGALLAYADIIRLFSLAPELPGAEALVRQLLRLGIKPAAGHSAATEDELAPVIDAGLGHMIHIWSGQSNTVRVGPWRKPGLLEVTLASKTLTSEMIADNRHLPPTLMQLAVKCLGPDRLAIVSDATPGAGLPEGARFRMGGMEYEVHDGVGMLLDRTAFAGSTTLLNRMLPVLIDVVGVPLVEAVRMASLTPAKIIGVDARKGSLQVGKDADIAIFEDDFSAWGVLSAGRWIVEPANLSVR